MGRIEEFKLRKKSKVIRKKNRAEGVEIKETEEAKRRKKRGARKVTQSMCYRLPTLEDPFNDRDPLDKKSKRVKTNTQKSQTPQEPKYSKSQNSKSQNSEFLNLNMFKTQNPKGQIEHVIDKSMDEDNEDDNNVAKRQKPENDKLNLPKSIHSPFKKIFWPGGHMGKAPLDGADDIRLPRAFISAYNEMAGVDTSESGVRKGQKNVSKLEKECWEGLLKGKNVFAILSDKNMKGFDSESEDKNADVDEKFDLHSTVGFSYLLPLIVQVSFQERSKIGEGSKAIIFVSSASRARQIRKYLLPFKNSLNIKSICLHEEKEIDVQALALESQNVEIIISTPLRLYHLYERGVISFKHISFLVLEDADMSMSSQHFDLACHIRNQIRSDCQSIILTRQISSEANQLAKHFLPDPIFRAASGKFFTADVACISQTVKVFSAEEKKLSIILKYLNQLSKEEKDKRVKSRIVIQVSEIPEMSKILNFFRKEKVKAIGFHSNMSTETQNSNLNKFLSGKVRILIFPQKSQCSLDIKLHTVPVYIMYNFPASIMEYAEILSKFGRQTTNAKSLVLFSQTNDLKFVIPLVRFLKECGQDVDSKLDLLVRAFHALQNKSVSNGNEMDSDEFMEEAEEEAEEEEEEEEEDEEDKDEEEG